MSTAVSTSAPTLASDERIARRLAVLLAERRRQSGVSLRALARASQGGFTARELKQIEAARRPLEPARARAVAELYGIDLAAISPDRLPLEIDPRGVISTGGSAISFEPGDVESLLTNYLRLIRSMRQQERPETIQLRRTDVETLAEHLDLPGEIVVERLASLMGATQLQRRVLAGLFVAGATAIGLSAAAAANLKAADGGRSAAPPSPRSNGIDGHD